MAGTVFLSMALFTAFTESRVRTAALPVIGDHAAVLQDELERAQVVDVVERIVADDDEIVVIGSQAILGSFPNAPAELLESMEADVFPREDELAGRGCPGGSMDRAGLLVCLLPGRKRV